MTSIAQTLKKYQIYIKQCWIIKSLQSLKKTNNQLKILKLYHPNLNKNKKDKLYSKLDKLMHIYKIIRKKLKNLLEKLISELKNNLNSLHPQVMFQILFNNQEHFKNLVQDLDNLKLSQYLNHYVFAQKKNAKQIRLWGKILGRQKDYYIAEGQADTTQQQGQLPADVEPKGTGINKTLYWVANNLTGDWTQLPIITSKQLQISRKIKYLFTGDLNRDILTNPDFVGKQSHLLKCQLVRINTTCTIVPKGMYNQNAQDPKQIQSPQQFNFPDINSLSQKQNWVYLNQSILKNGRISIIKLQGLQPQEQQKWMKQAVSKDPSEPRLKNIVLDNQNWSLKSYNLGQLYLTLGKIPKTQSKGIVGLKNLLWPGWLTVSYNGKFQSIYVGYGNKARQNYYPCEPETVLQQKQDRQQFVVPQ